MKLAPLFFDRRTSSKFQVDALDGLRGVAVLMVVWAHLSSIGLDPLPGVSFRGAGK